MENNFDIIRRIEELISGTLHYLKNLKPENFEINFSTAFNNLKQARELRESIKLEDLPVELEQKMKKINLTAKLIKKEYDNVIKNYSTDIDNIRLEMRDTVNKRKLASYSRGG